MGSTVIALAVQYYVRLQLRDRVLQKQRYSLVSVCGHGAANRCQHRRHESEDAESVQGRQGTSDAIPYQLLKDIRCKEVMRRNCVCRGDCRGNVAEGEMIIRQAINLCVYNAGIYIKIVKPVHWLPKHQYNVLMITIGAALSALFTCVSHLYRNTFFFKFIHYNIVYGNNFFF